MPIRRQCVEPLCTNPRRNGPRCLKCAQARNASGNYYLSPAWRRLRRQAIIRDGGRCVACSSTRRLVAHHVKGRRGGGPDDINNLITLCASCHSRYEADLRAGISTTHRCLIDHIAEHLLGDDRSRACPRPNPSPP